MIDQKINADAQYVPNDDLRTNKQVLVLRKDLGMTSGKMFAREPCQPGNDHGPR